MIVVDASVFVAALRHDGPAREALRDGELAAPYLVDAEVLHSLRGLNRRGELSDELAEDLLLRWAMVGLTRFGAEPLVARIWELRANLSAYDATYVALAEMLGCSLLTGDARLARAPGARCAITLLPS